MVGYSIYYMYKQSGCFNYTVVNLVADIEETVVMFY